MRFRNSQIKRLVDDGSQFIIAMHPPMIMAFPGVCLLELASEGIEEVDHWAAEHFCVIREFLNAPEKVLGELFEALRRLLPIAWVLRMPSVVIGRET